MTLNLRDVLSAANVPAGVFTSTPEPFNRLPAPLSSIEVIDGYKGITGTELKQILNGSGARLVNKKDDDWGILYATVFVTASFSLRLKKAAKLVDDHQPQLAIEIYTDAINLMEKQGNELILSTEDETVFSLARVYELRADAKKKVKDQSAETDYAKAAELYLKKGDIYIYNAYSMYIKRAKILSDADAADAYKKVIELVESMTELKIDRWELLSIQMKYAKSLEINPFRDEAVKAYKDLVDAAVITIGMGEGINPSEEVQSLLRSSEYEPSDQDRLKVKDFLEIEIDYLKQLQFSDDNMYSYCEQIVKRANLAARLNVRSKKLLELFVDAGRADLLEGALQAYENVYAKNGAWEEAADTALELGEYYKETNNWKGAGKTFERIASYYGNMVITNDKGDQDIVSKHVRYIEIGPSGSEHLIIVSLKNIEAQAEALKSAAEAYEKGGESADAVNKIRLRAISLGLQAACKRSIAIFFGADDNATTGFVSKPLLKYSPLNLAEAQELLELDKRGKFNEDIRPEFTNGAFQRFKIDNLIKYIIQEDQMTVLKELKEYGIAVKDSFRIEVYLNFYLSVSPFIRGLTRDQKTDWVQKRYDAFIMEEGEFRRPADRKNGAKDVSGRERPIDIPSDAAVKDIPADERMKDAKGGGEEGRKKREKDKPLDIK